MKKPVDDSPKGLAILLRPKSPMGMDDDSAGAGADAKPMDDKVDPGLVDAARDVQDAMDGPPEDLAKALQDFWSLCDPDDEPAKPSADADSSQE